MSCGDSGDVNVCLSRVGGFSEHLPAPSHSQAPATSLLTFADMVLALDNKACCDNSIDLSNRENLQDDHTYASNKSHKMTTRSQSQALRINNKNLKQEIHSHLETFDITNDRTEECLSNSDPGGMCSCDSFKTLLSAEGQSHSCQVHKHSQHNISLHSITHGHDGDFKSNHEMELKVKRSSSVENMKTESSTIDSFSEWPQIVRKNSPRKSCSFEEVNKNSTGSQRSEDRLKSGSSGQLHRLVNDTLEFPCWPRKADHTYATATWDGTAASHSIFEQEINQIESKREDLEMEVTEAYILPLKKRSLNTHLNDPQRNALALQSYACQQKDDHTYVKHNTSTSTSVNSFSGYSCSTFPRQKSRDDHTYFSSGLNKHGSSSAGGKDWNSLHTVSNLPHSQNKERTEFTGRRIVPEFISAKKDHNYFTSA